MVVAQGQILWPDPKGREKNELQFGSVWIWPFLVVSVGVGKPGNL